jgi:hypothetical protein
MIGLAEGVASVDDGLRSVRTLFEAVARARPLVLVFDDIHWAESTFLDLVEHLADWVREAPILLVCLARPELLDVRSRWGGGKLNATTSLLEPLSEDECATLIDNLVGSAGLTDAVRTAIAEAAEGNPLFVEEMLAMLIDEGLLVEESGRFDVTGDVSAVRVPPTIQALLAARLDRIPVDERAVLERASVAGKVFYEGAVHELSADGSPPAVEDALGALVRKELIRPQGAGLGGRTYRFRHLLIRDAAYESIPKEARAQLHAHFGRWLEDAAGERAAEYEEVVGYHLEQAYRYQAELGPVDDAARRIGREAAERLGAAGSRALERRDAPAGLNLIARAVALLPVDDPLRVALLPNMRVIQGASDLAWADAVLTQAVEAAARTGDRRLEAQALVQRGFLRLFTDRAVTPAELIATGEQAVAALDGTGHELGLARAWRLVAQAHYLGRRLGSCAEASERALVHVRRVGDPFEEREIVEWLVIALELGPAPADEAARRCRRLLDETTDATIRANITGALAYLVALQRRTDEANELMVRARALIEHTGEPMWLVHLWFGWIHLAREDAREAERELRPGYEALKALGEKTHFSSFAQALAAAAYRLGRWAQADELIRECERASRPNDVRSEVLWRTTRAKLMGRAGQPDAAETLAREAVQLAAGGDLHTTHADALLDLAEVLELRDDREGAVEALRAANRLFELKGNLLRVDHVRALLAD